MMGERGRALLVRLLMRLYPRWMRQEQGDEIERSYEDLLDGGDARRRGRLRMTLWLLRDALTTGLRARLAGRGLGRRPAAAAPGEDGLPVAGVGGRGDGALRRMVRDLALAVRSLSRSPGFTVVAVATLGLGIGLNSAIFGVVHSVLLQPLPYTDADRLVQLNNRYLPSGTTGWISGAEYWEYRQDDAAFDVLAPITTDAANLTGLPTPLRVEGLMVDPGFFDLVDVQPALGRAFLPDEARPGAEPVVILGHALWQTAFGADPETLGQTVEIAGRSRRVVGVMGPRYRPLSRYLFPGRAEEYLIPVVLDPAGFDQRSVEHHNLLVLGRLAEDVTPAAAERSLLDDVRRLERAYPGLSNEGARDVAVTTIHEAAVGPVQGTLLLLAGAAGLVLLVACVNVANLLLARADTRTAEIAVRAAMGAGRGRLVGHGLTESVVVGLLGGAAGLALTLAAREALQTLVPSDAPLPEGIAFGVPVAAFTFGLALAAGAVAGLIPALQIGRGDVFGAIKAGGGEERGAGRRSLLRRTLVVGQVAGAVVLVTSAALLLRSLTALRSVDAGFEARDLYGVQVSASGSAYPEARDVRDLYRAIELRAAEIPGVRHAAASWQTPLQSGMSDWPVMPRRDGESEWFSADPNLVGLDFFDAYGIEVLEGRGFEAGDLDRAVGPVILSRTGATRLFGDAPAVGQQVNLNFGDPVWREVVGVVEDVRGRGLGQEPRVQTYMTFGEGPFAANPSLVLNLRADVSAAALRQEVADVVHGVDPQIPVGTVESMEAVVADSLARERLLSVLLAVFAAVALLLGAIGVYGVVAYSVGQRTREIGLRIAIGARPASVLGLVVRQGLALGGAGVVLGVAGAVATAGLLEGFLFGVSGTDVATLGAVSAGMLVVAALASFLPARRAAGVDPLTALRE